MLPFDSMAMADAKRWLVASEVLLVFSAIVLAIGLVGEWPDSASWRKRIWYKPAKAAVIVGVLGELLGDAGIFGTTGRIEVLHEAEVLDVEMHLAARALTDEQKASIAASARTDLKAEFAFSVTTDEEAALAIALSESLERAGWKWVDWPAPLVQMTVALPGRPRVGWVLLSGIQVRILNPKLSTVADALVGSLRAANLEDVRIDSHDASAGFQDPNNGLLVEIMIGQRPTLKLPR